MRFTKPTMLIAVLVLILGLCGAMLAQTSTTGSVAGTVTDTSGAVIVGAQVTLTNVGTSATDTSKTNAAGYYTFPFEKPGDYKVTASSTGFVSASQPIAVPLGAEVTVNLRLAPAGAQEVVEVTGEAGAIQTENANLITNFNQKAVELLPNPGNDLSAVALTAPGVVMNTSGGSIFGGGNFEVYGLSATSNLFMIDGANDNDPYFNINNSGATNLMLGLNDIQEATVITNGYSGQYGGLAGANINYISKSGTNAYHGNVIYWWNGDYLDANTYFFNQLGTARPRVNANQYAGSIGGPIKKDKAFFFLDYEALRLVIPSPLSVNLPTYTPNAALGLTGPGLCPGCGAAGGFENQVLATLPAVDVPFYTHIFNIYNGTSGASGARNTLPGGGCSNYTGLAAGVPCAVEAELGAAAHTTDYLAAGRVDYIVGSKDKMYISIHHESGLQATYTDPINAAFTGVSQQPQWAPVQFSETHTFGSNKVNNFLTSLTWYSAFFGFENPGAEQALLPQQILFADGSLYPLNSFGGGGAPGGRNITRYQFTDDFSWSRGKHTIKFGAQYYRSDVTDLDLAVFSNLNPITEVFSLADFAAGGVGPEGDLAVQFFPQKQKVPIALYQLGLYLDDEVKVTPNLKLTLSIRADHLSDPVCQQNCFSQFAGGSFYNTDLAAPVNQQILANQRSPFPSVTGLVWQPKIGFAWSPFGSKKTVVRGGAGVFVDAIPTGAIVSLLLNAPLDPQFLVFDGPLNPAAPGSLLSTTAADNVAFVAGFGKPGAPGVPAFNYFAGTAVKPPRYYEWDLEVQREVGWRTTMSAKYVGNHGSFEAMSNAAVNAFGFANFPLTAPDPRLGTVTQIGNIANSNYDGLVVSAQHAAAGGFQFQASYTFSHALDEISNNPFTPFGLTPASGGNDIIFAQNPFNIRQFNYANATYDIRHYFNMNYVWSDAFRHLTSWGPNALMKGWNFSGTLFWHTGFPFTLNSSTASSAASSLNYGNVLFASQIGPSNLNCGASGAQLNNPCYNINNFATPGIFVNGVLSVPEYGQQTRNQFRGPGLFDTDLGVDKAFPLPRWEGASFSIGLRAFNLVNHPNFNFPVANINSPQFGSILSEVNTPTGIFGSGLGAANSPRLVQLQAKLVF